MRRTRAVVDGRGRWRQHVAVVLVCCACSGPARGDDAVVPGLGEIMSANQMRHLKLWYAGEAGNWPLAAYEIDELTEGFDDVVRFHPTHKDSPQPLRDLVPELIDAPLAQLRGAIGARDRPRFEAAFDTLTAACNACHRATHFGFNVIVRPTANPYSNQRFEPAP
jgi:hypothetical protein